MLKGLGKGVNRDPKTKHIMTKIMLNMNVKSLIGVVSFRYSLRFHFEYLMRSLCLCLAFASGGVWAAIGQSRPGCGGRRGVGRAAGGWAEAHGGGPGEAHGDVIITCLQDCRNCFRVILSGDNRVKKY